MTRLQQPQVVLAQWFEDDGHYQYVYVAPRVRSDKQAPPHVAAANLVPLYLGRDRVAAVISKLRPLGYDGQARSGPKQDIDDQTSQLLLSVIHTGARLAFVIQFSWSHEGVIEAAIDDFIELLELLPISSNSISYSIDRSR